MAASSWCKGAVTARLLTLRKANSTGKAAPKRHAQADFQREPPAGAWKVPSSRDLVSYAPSFYLLQQRQGSSSADSSSDGEGSASSDEEDAASSGSSSSSSTAPHWLAHTKPRKGSSAQVLLQLRTLTGSDLRDSQQASHTAALGLAADQGTTWLHQFVHLFHGGTPDLPASLLHIWVSFGPGSRPGHNLAASVCASFSWGDP
jgi:hypothetical protein